MKNIETVTVWQTNSNTGWWDDKRNIKTRNGYSERNI